MPLCLVRSLGNGLAFIHPLEGEGGVDPGYGHPIFGRPDQGLPGGRPDRPDQGLPGSGNYPSNGLPGAPGHPDNRPPATRPPTAGPGETLVLVRDAAGVWHYATLPSGSPPPKPVPVPPPTQPDNTLPPTAAPKA